MEENTTYSEEEIRKSVLLSVKKMLGYPAELTDFDTDIMTFINSSISSLSQLGVKSTPNFFVTGPEQTYENYLGENINKEGLIRSYLFIKVKLGFDPPQSSYINESYSQQLRELEFRILVENDDKGVTR